MVIGGLNWGLIGFIDFNLVEWLLGQWEVIVRIVYALVGLSAVGLLFSSAGKCKKCK